MAERRLFIEIFMLLSVLAGNRASAISGSSSLPAPATLGQTSSANEIWAERVINIHQPVYQPGYGSYQTVKPMLLTPPPPVLLENKILRPSPVYNAKEIRIANKAKIVSYPMHMPNQFNYYQFPRTYNPYFGKDAPGNTYHPYNMLYGPLPFDPVGGYGLPYGPSGERPTISGQLQLFRDFRPNDSIPTVQKLQDANVEEVDQSLNQFRNRALLSGFKPKSATYINRMEKMPVGSFDGLGMGFNSFNGVGFDPFSTQMGPFGPASPYATSTERQLTQLPGSSALPPNQMI